MDDFRKGKIEFRYYNLEPGSHSITVKVWDVFNNSSESTINFIVRAPDDLFIDNFIASPNPFSFFTDFYFEHNQSNKEFSYILKIYSITGVLVKTIEKTDYNTEGYRLGPINWDGKNNYGAKVNAGIYIAHLNVILKNGDFVSKSTRVIILP